MAVYRGCRALHARPEQCQRHGPVGRVAIRRRETRSAGCEGRGISHLPDRLPDAEHVALAVAEPAAALAARVLARVVALDVGDPADGPQPGDVDLLEDDAAGLQLGDGRVDVVDLEA